MDKQIMTRIVLTALIIGVIFEGIGLFISFNVINDLREAPGYWHAKYVECSVSDE